MFDKKNYVLNCDICDARKMKEEDYNNYKNMIINADIVIVSTSSKSILNRLPVTINQDYTIEIADDVETELKVINGSYEITDSMVVQEHTLLIVNGALNIHSGTKEILEKYEKIHVNGSVRCAESISGYLTKLSASNSVSIYPDDCMILNDTFIVDKYFPLRAKEGNKYYVKDKVILQDKSVDLQKLVEKNVRFVTEQLIIPEEMVESCIELFDEKVDFVVIPAGMTSSNTRPSLAIRDGFVVTPQITPMSFAFLISSTFAVSIKNFIACPSLKSSSICYNSII